MSVRAVLDTNVLVSGIFWKGPPFEILGAWRQGRFTLVVSIPILEEYRRVVGEVLVDRSSNTADSILEVVELHSLMVEAVSFAEPVCDDADDDKFLEAAIAGSASYVVTGDAALLRLRNLGEIDIVKPARFLNLLSR